MLTDDFIRDLQRWYAFPGSDLKLARAIESAVRAQVIESLTDLATAASMQSQVDTINMCIKAVRALAQTPETHHD